MCYGMAASAPVQGYPAEPQSPSWHASPMQPCSLGTPPMSPSSLSGDFTHLTSSGVVTPSASAASTAAGELACMRYPRPQLPSSLSAYVAQFNTNLYVKQ